MQIQGTRVWNGRVNYFILPSTHFKNHRLIEYITYSKFLVSDGYDTAQETSNSQQYG